MCSKPGSELSFFMMCHDIKLPAGGTLSLKLGLLWPQFRVDDLTVLREAPLGI